MAEVIKMVDHKPRPTIKPKSETYKEGGQEYTITFDPHTKTYVWEVAYVRTYQYVGNAPTLGEAATKARRKIHSLNRFVRDTEERNG